MEPSGLEGEERGRAGYVALLLLLVLGCRLLALRSCPIYDDAFITYRYAENLAEGRGLVFNAGAEWEPVLGTTTPGYAVLLGLAGLLGLPIPGASLALNLLFDLLSAWLLLELLAGRRLAQVVAVFLFAGLPHVARISVGGMEAPLLAFLALAAAAALGRRRPALAGLAAALACTVRPEAVLLAGLGGLTLAKRPRELLRFALPVAAVGLVTIALLTAAYGSPIPHSVTAKSATHAAASSGLAWQRVADVLRQSFLPSVLLLPLLPAVVAGFGRGLRERGGARLVLAFGLAITAGYLIARPHTWGWYYYVPLVAWSLACGLGAARAAERLGLAPRLSAWTAGPRLVLLAVLALVTGVFVTGAFPDRITREVYEPMRAWVAAQGLDDPAVEIVASDIGAVGWMARARVLDSEGLVWPGALEYHRRAGGVHAAQMDLVEAERPDYLMLVVERGRVEALRARPGLRALYEPVARFNALGYDDLEPPLDVLPARWRQDYLFYRRRE